MEHMGRGEEGAPKGRKTKKKRGDLLGEEGMEKGMREGIGEEIGDGMGRLKGKGRTKEVSGEPREKGAFDGQVQQMLGGITGKTEL
uniref:Uncharacterized protein n=1 Tax=Chromera velia CCMP2878 TaxID=1169474 RepID=A0A0G4GJ69_9ALVE|eukprot:Cvel_4772.t1-p1 / transcript=Cvel_4772.t1 / gene=Cvel_4772 / organism=Chromera_velia_CCMP2878 / gene_product=hypothetical protein / transcript_product=hypothetical protein / location=Cvel_scaffold213:12360-12614(+) / protein_length=85 / sequence_SO=supercontig / SO=protein_coding / is_pseudo=false